MCCLLEKQNKKEGRKEGWKERGKKKRKKEKERKERGYLVEDANVGQGWFHRRKWKMSF